MKSLRCFTSLLLKWNLWLHSLRCFTSLLLKSNLWRRSPRCLNSLPSKWNLWIRLLRCFISLLLKRNLWLRPLRRFSSFLLKLNFWLPSLRCPIYYYLIEILHYACYATLIQVTENNFHDISDWKMIFLTTLTMLFYFTTINPRDRTTVITLLLSIKHFSSQELQCIPKICMRESHFTARKLSLTCFTILFSDFWPNFPFNTSETMLDYYL